MAFGIAALLALATAAAAPGEPPPPAVLAPYVHDGRFDPGDYRWMRGSFADADAAAKADMAAIRGWMTACRDAGLAATRAELATLGIGDAKLEREPAGTLLCRSIFLPLLPAGTTYAAFAAALPRARLVADTYLFAVEMAEQSTGAPDLAGALAMRPVTEQMLRRAFSWGEGDSRRAPPLDPVVRAILDSRIGIATSERDHANTEWLKDVVAREGWPSLSKVGPAAAGSAWLMVQHADADPAFQLRMLRLMEPLEAKHDLPKGNYAYLYDRVMLKLVGRQRYATQVECRAGRRVPQPLEDAAAMPEWRRKAAMQPFADYVASMDRSFGACPPEPVGKHEGHG